MSLERFRKQVDRATNIHEAIARELPDLVHCTVCGRAQRVDTAYCLRHGWPKCHGETMHLERFHSGQRVRVKATAWPGSNEPEDVHARGQVIKLKWVIDDDDGDPLWEAELDSGLIVYPLESELEAVP